MEAAMTSPGTRHKTDCRILATASIRCSEWVIMAFLVYSALMGSALSIAPSLETRTLLLNVAMLTGYGLLIRADTVRPGMITSVVRDWLPLPLILFAYREVGWFALPHPGHELEMQWVALDRVVLRCSTTWRQSRDRVPRTPAAVHPGDRVCLGLHFGAVLPRGIVRFRQPHEGGLFPVRLCDRSPAVVRAASPLAFRAASHRLSQRGRAGVPDALSPVQFVDAGRLRHSYRRFSQCPRGRSFRCGVRNETRSARKAVGYTACSSAWRP